VTTDAQKHFTTFPEALLAPTITIIIIINILKIKFKKIITIKLNKLQTGSVKNTPNCLQQRE